MKAYAIEDIERLESRIAALEAVAEAGRAYYEFTRKPEPAGFNNDYNQEAIRVGAAMKQALDALDKEENGDD